MIKAKVEFNARHALIGHESVRGLDITYDKTEILITWGIQVSNPRKILETTLTKVLRVVAKKALINDALWT